MDRRTGITARGNSIKISFQYRGARCREQFKLAPTKANLRWAANRKALIEDEIARGVFDYAKHFPDSKHLRRFSLAPARSVTVGDVLREWLAHVRLQHQPETYQDYSEYVRNTWLPEFGAMRLADFTLANVSTWISAQRVSKKRILNLLTPLREAMRYAVKPAGLLLADPLAGIKVKRATALAADKIDPFTRAEVDAVLAQLEPTVANMVEFWVWTGLREGEVFALTWADVDFDRGVIRVDKATRGTRVKVPKTEAGRREVKLLAPALAALSRQKPFTRLLHREVFLNPGHVSGYRGSDGKAHRGPIKPSTVNRPWRNDKTLRRRWEAAVKRSQVRYRPPKQLRHTYASWMLNAGESPLWVSRQMGHADLSVTLKRYTRFIADMNTEAGMLAVAKLGTTRAQT